MKKPTIVVVIILLLILAVFLFFFVPKRAQPSEKLSMSSSGQITQTGEVSEENGESTQTQTGNVQTSAVTQSGSTSSGGIIETNPKKTLDIEDESIVKDICSDIEKNSAKKIQKYIAESAPQDPYVISYNQLKQVYKDEGVKDYENLKKLVSGDCESDDEGFTKYCNDLKNGNTSNPVIATIDNFTCDSSTLDSKAYIVGLLKSGTKCDFPKTLNARAILFYHHYVQDKSKYFQSLDTLFLRTVCKL